MSNTKPNLIEIFKSETRSDRYKYSSTFYHTYTTLFQTLDDYSFVERVYQDYKEEKDNFKQWFTSFHKCLRQTDFFGNSTNIQCNRIVDKTTDEQKQEIKTIKKEIEKRRDTITTPELEDDYQKYREVLRNDTIYQDLLKQRKRLYEIETTKEPISISGVLDVMLYNTICEDQKGVLVEMFERSFMEYDYQLSKQVTHE